MAVRVPMRGGLSPSDAWQKFLQLPLSDMEARKIASNVAPYMN
jgi:hypothetical protein